MLVVAERSSEQLRQISAVQRFVEQVLDTLSRVGRSHYWTTNEFEHDGVHGSVVFKRLFNEALNRGDLEELF